MTEDAPTTIGFPPKTIATPRWGDMNIGKYAELQYLEENEGYMIADRTNWWIPTETCWKRAPGKAWSMLERRQVGVGSKGEPIYSYTKVERPVHWLFGEVVEKPDPEQGPVPASAKMAAWHYKITDPSTPGSGKLQWHELGQHAIDTINRMRMMIRHLHYTQLQEAAPQYPLIQLVDWTQVQTSTSNSFGAVEVIDMVTVAPHSWFNMQLNIFLYKYDDIPEELVMTHQLNDEDPAHRDILARQKVMRKGALTITCLVNNSTCGTSTPSTRSKISSSLRTK